MIEEVASAPDWVIFFQYAGIVAGALIPIALLFKGVRDWVATKWRAIIGSRVSQKQFAEKIEGLDHKIDKVVASLGLIDKAMERVGLMESMLRITADRDDLSAVIYCDEMGRVTFASRSLAAWLETSKTDLLGWRWLNYVDSDQRKAVRDEILLVQSEHRELRMKIKMGPHGEPPGTYLLTMSPMPDNPPAKAWAGYIVPLPAPGTVVEP